MKKHDSCLKSIYGGAERPKGTVPGYGAVAIELARSGEVTYLTTDELSSKIKYDPRTIRERLKDSVLLEGIHYIRPFGGRKILYIWEKIEADMSCAVATSFAIPMASGGVCHG